MKRLIGILLIIIFAFSGILIAQASDEECTPSGVPLSSIEEFVDDYMSQYIGTTTPGAAVVLVKDGQIILSKGYGYADIESGILVSSKDTVFEYGSISKLFVYTTIMQFAEQGKLDLNADVRDYLPENFLKKLKYDEPVTLMHIMNHTTGFEDYLFDVILTNDKNFPGLEQTLINAQPAQVSKPGTVAAYSNYAVALAAYIAERITGQDFYAYITDKIFVPLDMTQTSSHPTLADKPMLTGNKANCYFPHSDGQFQPGGWSYVTLYPAGGINGTAEDLAQFAMALMPEEGQPSTLFENRQTLDTMLTQSFELGPGIGGFAHGFFEFDGEYRAVGHGGNTAYFSTRMNIVPEQRFGVIILTNSANEMHITGGLTEALIGKKDKTVMVGEGNHPDAAGVQGTYISARRMHNGFLELYSYLTLLNVKAVDQNSIELNVIGQNSTLVQTSPYVFERVNANGPILEYYAGKLYFEVENGAVTRISGDYLPLPAGRTMPWLIASLIIVVISAVYLVVAPVVLLVCKLRKRKTAVRTHVKDSRRYFKLVVLSGASLLINNAVLVLRMLMNNYRSFSEFRFQIMLNYPLAVLAALFAVLSIVFWKSSHLTNKNKVFGIASIVMVALFIGTLLSWQFFCLL